MQNTESMHNPSNPLPPSTYSPLPPPSNPPLIHLPLLPPSLPVHSDSESARLAARGANSNPNTFEGVGIYITDKIFLDSILNKISQLEYFNVSFVCQSLFEFPYNHFKIFHFSYLYTIIIKKYYFGFSIIISMINTNFITMMMMMMILMKQASMYVYV